MAFIEGSTNDDGSSPSFFTLSTTDSSIFQMGSGNTQLQFLQTGTYLVTAFAIFSTATGSPVQNTSLRLNWGGSGLAGSNSFQWLLRDDVATGIQGYSAAAGHWIWKLAGVWLLNVLSTATIPSLRITVTSTAGPVISADDMTLAAIRLRGTPFNPSP